MEETNNINEKNNIKINLKKDEIIIKITQEAKYEDILE